MPCAHQKLVFLNATISVEENVLTQANVLLLDWAVQTSQHPWV